MWPFDQARERARKRAFDAALIVLVGTYLYPHLDKTQKARVEDEVEKILKKAFEPPVTYRRAKWYVHGALRAVAMARAGIEPVNGIVLAHLLESWPPRVGPFDTQAFEIALGYRAMNDATEEAKSVLRSRGVSIPTVDPIEKDALDLLDASGEFAQAAGFSQNWQTNK